MASALISGDDIREHVEADLSDSALERLVDAADGDILRTHGPHDGERAVTLRSTTPSQYLWLPRPAASLGFVLSGQVAPRLLAHLPVDMDVSSLGLGQLWSGTGASSSADLDLIPGESLDAVSVVVHHDTGTFGLTLQFALTGSHAISLEEFFESSTESLYIGRSDGSVIALPSSAFDEIRNNDSAVWNLTEAQGSFFEMFDAGDMFWIAMASADAYASDGYELAYNGRAIVRGGYWPRTVTVAYAPVAENDRRTQALIDLVQLELQYRGLQSERTGSYQATFRDHEKERKRILARLRHNYPGGGLLR